MSFCKCASPGFPLEERIIVIPARIYKRGVGISPSSVPCFKAFAMPYHQERTTQKAHADMYNTRNLPLFRQREARMYINTHQEDVLVAIRHSGGQSLRSSETRKTNACKRLLYIHGSPTTRRLSAEESVANVNKKMRL